MAVNLTNGDKSLPFDVYTSNEEHRLFDIRDLVIDSTNRRAIVVDAQLDAVIALGLDDGTWITISDPSTPNVGYAFENPRGMALDIENNQILVMDANLKTLFAVNLASGIRTVISNNTTPNTDNEFINPNKIVLDRTNNRVLVGDTSFNGIFSVDLATGARSVFSSEGIPDNDNIIGDPLSLALDSTNNRLLVIGADNLFSPKRMLAINLDNGVRTVISSSNIPNGDNQFGFMVNAMKVNAEQNKAYVLGFAEVLSVDLTTGVRTILSNNSIPNNITPLNGNNSFGLGLDAENNRLVITDAGGRLFSVDIRTGQRVILSR